VSSPSNFSQGMVYAISMQLAGVEAL